MKQRLLAILCTLVIVLLASGCTAEEKKVELKDMKDKVSYAIGLSIGMDFKKQELQIDPDLIARGVRDGFSDATPLMTEEEIKQVQGDFQKEIMAKQEERSKKLAEDNQKKSEEFLAENAKKEGVKTTESGLQYEIITEGSGASPKTTDVVKVHYVGTLADGTEFDSSVKRGEPATFPVQGVIPGWTEALQLMKTGGKWKIVIPPALAYGERGAGQVIGPNQVLIFEVELLEIQDNPVKPANPAAKK